MIACNPPRISHVNIVRFEGRVHIHPVWTGVDRPIVDSWQLDDTLLNLRWASQLKKAILAGEVYSDPQVACDVNGKTYVSARRE